MNIKKHQSDNHIMNGHRARSSWRTLAGILAVIVTFVTTYSLILPAITVSVDQVEEVGGLYLEEDDAEYEIVEDIDEQYELIPQGTDTPLAGYGTEGTLDGEFIEDDDQLAETESEMEAAGIELWNETEEETETETETEIESESKTETGTEAGAVIETEVETETDAEIETELKTEAGIETETEAETETETETEVLTDAETENTTGFNTRVAIDKNILASDGKNYKVTVTYGAEAGIPEGAELQVEEILPGKSREYEADDNHRNAHSTHDKNYEEYVSRTQDALDDGEKVAFARFFDITIVKDGTEIQPSEDVDVRIELADELSENVKAVHFGDEVEVLDAARVDAESLNDAVEFTASGFSVYGIVGTTIEKIVLASDGNNYRITVTCGANSGIPADADLAVEEILAESELYGEFVSKTENALGMEEGTAGYIRLFDISIVNKDDQSIEYQPTAGTTVDVRIELVDSESESLSVVHFADEQDEGSVVDAEVDDQIISFETSGFSVYAIVEGPDAAENNLQAITDLDELNSNSNAGFYLSYTNNKGKTFYFTNTLTQSDCLNETDTLSSASLWYFEQIEGDGNENKYKIFTYVNNVKKYIHNKSGNLVELSENGDIIELSATDNNRFYFKKTDEGKWLQHSNGGQGIRYYTDKNDAYNTKIAITMPAKDPYGLDGTTYGLLYTDNTLYARGLDSTPVDGGSALAAKAMPQLDRKKSSEVLYVTNDSDMTEWKFTCVRADKYHITAQVNGQTKYLTVTDNGVTLEDEPTANSLITVTPGTGNNKGKIRLSVGDYSVNYFSSNSDRKFTSSNSASGDTVWLNLAEKSSLSSDDVLIYTAHKVSVSDNDSVHDYETQKLDTEGNPILDQNGAVETTHEKSQVVIYTRIWDDDLKKYEFYALDSDGSLHHVFESGDVIQWAEGQTNSLLWEFTEYHEKGDQGEVDENHRYITPNYFYELQNVTSGEYLAPQLTGLQTISSETLGVSLQGRRYGRDYSTIIAWDSKESQYVGLKTVKTEDGYKVIPCPMSQADDFYFAIMEMNDVSYQDELTTVRTVDNDMYGISMKMINFGENGNITGNNRAIEQNNFFGGDHSNGSALTGETGLLSANLGEDGYPVRTGTTNSLANLYDSTQLTPVNHLFIQSIYNESGYFEYDSTQNFASLNEDNTFTVYDQIAAIGDTNSDTRTHGQFMPYNDIQAGKYSKVTNQTDVLRNLLPEDDPRKGERLYKIDDTAANYFFGMEMEASFTQTTDGKDDWEHDIIFEFTGDDDFWLYVDGILVLDLGGIHRAQYGKVNFRTGKVTTSHGESTLYEIFEQNYTENNPNASESDVSHYMNEHFKMNDDGQYVFTDYSVHTMKMFYMERGAGASNLKMRFNLASVRPGTVLLSKTVSGADDFDSNLMEFPYQIYYKTEENGEYKLLGPDEQYFSVLYKGTNQTVKYAEHATVKGIPYDHVFFLKPGETMEIDFPENTFMYYIQECGVDSNIYGQVTVKSNLSEQEEVVEQDIDGSALRDYKIIGKTVKERTNVVYNNKPELFTVIQ